MTSDNCSKIVQHLSRIQGQIEALKRYIDEHRSCEEVSHLTRSILTSFGSVRTTIIEETLTRELATRKLSPQEQERLRALLTLFKS